MPNVQMLPFLLDMMPGWKWICRLPEAAKELQYFLLKIFGEGVTHVYDIQDVKGQGIRPWNWQVNGTNRRLLARELFPEIYEQEKSLKIL